MHSLALGSPPSTSCPPRRPGTGKTFSVREVVRAWRQQGKHVMLACPTARAASVLSTSVGLPASTIHRLLDFNPQEKAFRRDKLNPLPTFAVARVRPDLVAGFVGAIVHT